MTVIADDFTFTDHTSVDQPQPWGRAISCNNPPGEAAMSINLTGTVYHLNHAVSTTVYTITHTHPHPHPHPPWGRAISCNNPPGEATMSINLTGTVYHLNHAVSIYYSPTLLPSHTLTLTHNQPNPHPKSIPHHQQHPHHGKRSKLFSDVQQSLQKIYSL